MTAGGLRGGWPAGQIGGDTNTANIPSQVLVPIDYQGGLSKSASRLRSGLSCSDAALGTATPSVEVS